MTNPGNEIWYKATDDTQSNWVRLPNQAAKRVAVMNARSVYFVGTDNDVDRTDLNGNAAEVGTVAAEVAASADDTVVVTNANHRTMWQKVTDDTGNVWTRLPRTWKAVSVAAPGSGRTVAVGLDANVSRN